MRRALPHVIPNLLLVVMLWLPFGFHMGPIWEEWGVLELYANFGPFVFAGPGSLMPQHGMRPMMTTLWGLAFMVDPNSWWFWHFELALLLIAKGAAMSSITYYLTQSRRWAVVAGLLFMVWPADTLQMSFRASPITLAVVATAGSAALMLGALYAGTIVRRLVLSLLAATVLLVGAWTYELTLAFWPLPFLLVWAREGLRLAVGVLHRAWQAATVWSLAAVFSAGYVVWVLKTGKGLYQSNVANQNKDLVATLVDHFPSLFSMGALRALVTGWVDAARIFGQDLDAHWYFVLVGALFVAVFFVWRQRGAATLSVLARVLALGVGCVLVGYAPYILTHLNTTDRTFMFPALGATLVFVAMLVAVEKLSSTTASMVAVVLLTLGSAQQVWQFREYSSLYSRQRELLKAIVEQAPSLDRNKTLIIADSSQQLLEDYMLGDRILSPALSYLYGQQVYGSPIEVCFPQSGLWANRDEALQQGTCEETPEGDWRFQQAEPVKGIAHTSEPRMPVVVPREKSMVVRIGPDGRGAQAPKRLEATSVAAARYRGVLGPDTWPLRIFERSPNSVYRWDFGRRWSMQDVKKGSGFSYGSWTYKPLRQVSTLWMNKPRAQLLFELVPQSPSDYVVSAKLASIAEFDVSSLRVKLNGIEAAVHWDTPLRWTAKLPAGAAQRGSNILEIQTTPSRDPWGVSMQFDRIELTPASSPN